MSEQQHRQTPEKKTRRSNPYILLWVLLLLLITLPVILLSGIGRKKNTIQVQEGLSCLAELAERDPAEVEKTVRMRKVEQLQTQLEENEENQEDAINDRVEELDDSAIWEQFSDFVIMGDSRAVGFTVYQLLDSSRIFAEGGATIRDIPNYLDEAATLNPAYVYLCFGLNDTGIGYWSTGEEYAAEMDERITQLQTAIPGVTVIVNSILPATEGAMEASPVWRKIPAFSSAVKELCEERGVPFVDNDALADKYMATLWDEDGVHLKKEFYAYWAKNMIITTIEADYS